MDYAIRALCLDLLSCCAAAAAVPWSDHVVNVGYASFKGVVSKEYNNVVGFYGLHYAAAPTGDLRWRAPKDIEEVYHAKPGTVEDATQIGPECLQGVPAWYPGNYSSGPPSEDCLTLNVMTPVNPSSRKLPVVLEIHGGGYTLGNSSSYPGTYLTSRSKGAIVFVSIQYRLGALGFLNSDEIKADGSANVGLLDQAKAIQWVQRHIAAFGGDPDKVTLLGGSAGGGSVSAQLIMNADVARPGFRAAIPEYPWFQPYHKDNVTQGQFNDLLALTSCLDLACLRQIPFAKLSAAIDKSYLSGYAARKYGYGDFYYGPTVDGNVIRALPSTEYARGNFARVPVLTDHDGLEGFIFSNFSLTTEQQVHTDLQTLWPQADAEFFQGIDKVFPTSAFGSAYLTALHNLTDNPIFQQDLPYGPIAASPSLRDDSAYWRRQDIFGDAFINCPTAMIARTLTEHQLPVWKSVYTSSGLVHGSVDYGIFQPPSPGVLVNEAFREQDYLLSFITSMDPNHGSFSGLERPYWPSYGAAGNVLNINYTGISTSWDRDNSARCQFFHENAGVTLN